MPEIQTQAVAIAMQVQQMNQQQRLGMHDAVAIRQVRGYRPP